MEAGAVGALLLVLSIAYRANRRDREKARKEAEKRSRELDKQAGEKRARENDGLYMVLAYNRDCELRSEAGWPVYEDRGCDFDDFCRRHPTPDGCWHSTYQEIAKRTVEDYRDEWEFMCRLADRRA